MSFAQSLSLDPGFGNNGIAVCQESGRTSVAHDLTQQTDAKILAVGMTYVNNGQMYYESLITRFMANGHLDNSFGVNGSVKLNTGYKNGAYAVKVQTDGKIVVVGNETMEIPQGGGVQIISRPFIARLTASGAPDNSFGNNGIHYLDILNSLFDKELSSLLLLQDGRIVAGGNVFTGTMHQMLLVCLNVDGSYDTNFGNSGMITYTVENGKDAALMDMALQSDGKMLLAGASGGISMVEPPDSKFALVRVTANGVLDQGFGNQGFVLTQVSVNVPNPADYVAKVRVQPDGKICVAGNSGARLAMVRYLTDGTYDMAFGQNGIVISEGRPTPTGLTLSNGKIYTCGSVQGNSDDLTMYVSGFYANGAADTTINPDAIYTLNAYQRNYTHAMMTQADGKLLVAGSFRDENDERGTLLVRLRPSTTTSVEQVNPHQPEIKLYPNPATDKLILLREGNGLSAQDAITIFNALGQVVYSGTSTGRETIIPVGTFSAGNYMLRLTGEGYSQVQKFQKLK